MSILSVGPLTYDHAYPEIPNSLRFNGTSSYLARTYVSAGNRRKWTWSGWVKRSAISTARLGLFGGGSAATDTGAMLLEFYNDYTLRFSTGATQMFRSQSLYRDPSSHLHVVLVFDCSNATTGDRVILYVNGVRVTSSAYSAPSDADHFVNSAGVHYLGCYGVTVPNLFLAGYLSYPCFIDGQALIPSDFGFTDIYGQWRSKSKSDLIALSKAGGMNSFFLPFDNGASTTTLGYDASAKGNNWTLTSMVRDGSTNDCWTIDTPTNNFAILNPLYNGGAIVSNGALRSTSGGSNGIGSTIFISNEKIYVETVFGVSGSIGIFGIVRSGQSLVSATTSGITNGNAYYWGVGDGAYASSFQYGTSNSGSSTTYQAITGDVLAMTIDMIAGQIKYYKNNLLVYTSTGPTSGDWCVFTSVYTNITFDVNFGQLPVAGGSFYADAGGYFRYTPPTGFKALCTKNISDSSSIITSGTFTGNAAADGPFVYLNGTPTAMTIDGNAVTWGTHADKLANGFKIRTASSPYNDAASNAFSVTVSGNKFKYANAQTN